MTRLLRLDECATRTATSVRWWRRAVFEKRVGYVKLGRLVRIPEDELDRIVAAGRTEARP